LRSFEIVAEVRGLAAAEEKLAVGAR